MSRVIKYRAWDIEAKEMLHWHDDAEVILQAIPLDAGDEWTDRCVVEQFTGLLDKNGVEIYEGDIIEKITSMLVDDTGYSSERSEHVDATGTVVYDQYEAQFQLQYPCKGGVAKADFRHAYMSWAGVRRYRILGNIHEHSYLLNPKTT